MLFFSAHANFTLSRCLVIELWLFNSMFFSVEAAPGVDLEGLEVAKECVNDAFKLDSPTIDDDRLEPGLLIGLFRSLEANGLQKNKSDPSSGAAPVDAPTSSNNNINNDGVCVILLFIASALLGFNWKAF